MGGPTVEEGTSKRFTSIIVASNAIQCQASSPSHRLLDSPHSSLEPTRPPMRLAAPKEPLLITFIALRSGGRRQSRPSSRLPNGVGWMERAWSKHARTNTASMQAASQCNHQPIIHKDGPWMGPYWPLYTYPTEYKSNLTNNFAMVILGSTQSHMQLFYELSKIKTF